MTVHSVRPSHQRRPRSRRVRRRWNTARILPHFTPRWPERGIAPPTQREAGCRMRRGNTTSTADSVTSAADRLASRPALSPPVSGTLATELAAMTKPHTQAAASRTRSGYETDTTFNMDDALDDDDDDGDEALATFSSSKTIHESADVVRIAAFPAPPVIEEDEASPVDWAPALPPKDRWPADLADLHANNPAGAQTWTEVEAAMQRLVLYHAVRDTTRLIFAMARRSRRAHARERPCTRARSTLLADAARLLASPKRMCQSP